MQQQQQAFAGTVVIVTGAGHGIGRAIAERFGQAGASVVANDIRQQVDEVAEAIKRTGGAALSVVADVSQKAEVDRLFDAALERFGDVNVLVNNAALLG